MLSAGVCDDKKSLHFKSKVATKTEISRLKVSGLRRVTLPDSDESLRNRTYPSCGILSQHRQTGLQPPSTQLQKLVDIIFLLRVTVHYVYKCSLFPRRSLSSITIHNSTFLTQSFLLSPKPPTCLNNVSYSTQDTPLLSPQISSTTQSRSTMHAKPSKPSAASSAARPRCTQAVTRALQPSTRRRTSSAGTTRSTLSETSSSPGETST